MQTMMSGSDVDEGHLSFSVPCIKDEVPCSLDSYIQIWLISRICQRMPSRRAGASALILSPALPCCAAPWHHEHFTSALHSAQPFHLAFQQKASFPHLMSCCPVLFRRVFEGVMGPAGDGTPVRHATSDADVQGAGHRLRGRHDRL